ncbi:MAG: hypothetical protein R3A48_12850 [Polyangiales bacterium]
MSRETIASLSATLLPFLLVALAALGARLVAFAAQHIRDKRLSVAVQLAAYGAAAVVADVAQHVVEDLKDPNKPGTWDKIAMSSARTTAIARVRKLYPGAVSVITAALKDPGKVEELLGTLVERAVVELKGASLGAPSSEPRLVPPPSSKVPPPIPPQAGFARPGAVALLLAVALCLAGLGAVLTGCPPVPPTDGGAPVVTPSDWTRTARIATSVGRGLIPVARVIVEATTTDPGRTQARRAFDAADDALVGLDRALDAYDARGGDRCVAHAAAGAAMVALQELAQVLADNGIALGVPLGRIVDLVASVVDTLVPACDLDAGFASAGRAANTRLLSIEREARSRGVILRRDLDRIVPVLDGGVR